MIMLNTVTYCQGTEFMFELPDRDRQCFYEEIKKGVSSNLEYQVNIKYAVTCPMIRSAIVLFPYKAHHHSFYSAQNYAPLYFNR